MLAHRAVKINENKKFSCRREAVGHIFILNSCLVTLFANSWCGKSAFESVGMLNVKSVSDGSGFQLAASHP